MPTSRCRPPAARLIPPVPGSRSLHLPGAGRSVLDRRSQRPPGIPDGRHGQPAQRNTAIPKATTQAAEAKFAAARNKAKAVTEYEKQQQEVAKRTARLRELRLAKEAADKEAVEAEAAARPTPTAKKAKAKPKAAKPAKRTTRTY